MGKRMAPCRICGELAYVGPNGGEPAHAKCKATIGASNPDPSIAIEFPDKKHPAINLDRWLSHAKEGQQLRKESSGSQNKATVVIKTKKPIAVCFSADWHLGSSGCDYDALRAHHKYLRDTPGLFLISCGDLIENTRSFKVIEAVLSQVIPPDIQGRVLGAMMQELIDANKFLAACWGNHDDERDRKIFGQSPIAQWFGERRPYFPGIGHLTLRVGSVDYSILLDHKTRFNSFQNPLHGNYRIHQINEAADVVVTAHTHNPAGEYLYRYGKRVLFLKCGTFQDDLHSQRYYEPGRIGTPTVVFHPTAHKAVLFEEPADAVIYMRGLNHAA